MDVSEILAWMALAGAAWFWYDSSRAKEAAVAAAKRACASEDLQFLDDTVALVRLWPVREGDGRLRLQRVYGFEYSDTGDNRIKGSIVLCGQRILTVHVGMRPRPATLLH